MSGNEIFCLAQKGLEPGELVVGNSVYSMGFGGAIGAGLKSIQGGEVTQITELVNSGRHQAIERMEQEAQREGATGVTGVTSGIGRMAGFLEFLAQGTGVHIIGGGSSPFFSTAASGVDLYCQLDAGYHPKRFAMGNIAYSLGIGRGISGSLRQLSRGEVREFSEMYNGIRHTALQRMRQDAAQAGANAVVDTAINLSMFGTTAELMMTGTASFHPSLSSGPVREDQVVTSELSGEELWNLAKIGFMPLQIVMATSVYSLGVAGSFGAMIKSFNRGELTEVTKLIYEARENCLDLIRAEATAFGADRVMSTRLNIRELTPGIIELVAIGTAVKRAPDNMKPQAPALIPQAVIQDRPDTFNGLQPMFSPMNVARQGVAQGGNAVLGCIAVLIVMLIMIASVVFIWAVNS